mgnify:CR=1 FL=1
MDNTIQHDSGRGETVPGGSNADPAQPGGGCCGPATDGRGLGRLLPAWLGGTRGIIVGAVVVLGAGLALGWPTLVALGVAPILLSVLPCALMCGLGLCVMGRGGQSKSTQASTPRPLAVEQAPRAIGPDLEATPPQRYAREPASQS